MGQRPLSDAGCLAGWATTDWELRPGLPGHRRSAPAPGVGPRHPALLTHRRITAHLDGAPTQLPRLRRRSPPRHCAASGRTAYRGRGTRLHRVPFHGLRHSATTLLLERDLQLVVIKERCGDLHIGVTYRRVVYGVALTTTPAILSAPIDATRSRPSPGPTTVTDCRPEHHLSDDVAVSYCRPDITKAPPKSDPVGPLSSGQKSEPAFSQRRKGGYQESAAMAITSSTLMPASMLPSKLYPSSQNTRSISAGTKPRYQSANLAAKARGESR